MSTFLRLRKAVIAVLFTAAMATGLTVATQAPASAGHTNFNFWDSRPTQYTEDLMCRYRNDTGYRIGGQGSSKWFYKNEGWAYSNRWRWGVYHVHHVYIWGLFAGSNWYRVGYWDTACYSSGYSTSSGNPY